MISLLLGDCLVHLKDMESNSVDSIITDPPYGISFMAKKWDYDIPSIEIWKECLRVLKPGGHLLSFGGSRTFHRIAVSIEDAGFDIRDTIMWIYGTGFPKSLNIGKKIPEYEGWGTALKPSYEPIIMARKPFIGTVSDNVLAYGTGGINIDSCRVECNDKTKFPVGDYSTDTTIGKIRNNNRTEDTNKNGRFPANILHDGSDEAIEGFPNTGSSISSNTNSNGGDFPDNTIKLGLKQIQRNGFNDSGSAARYFYCVKASKRDRNEGCEDLEEKSIGDKGNGLGRVCETCGTSILKPCECPDRSFINPSVKNNHPTVKPTELMKYLCRLITPLNGIVLDPFMGSGSTGKAALLEGFSFIGIEMDEDYFEIAKRRVKK